MLLLKIPAKQGIIAESEAKPKSRRWTSGEMKDTNKLVQDYVASIPFDQRLYRQDTADRCPFASQHVLLRKERLW